MILVTWNVNGWRSVVRKGAMDALLERDAPDVLCLQEVKLSSPKDLEAWADARGYDAHVHLGERKGYSGTATLVRRERLAKRVRSVERWGDEGRVVVLRLDDLTIVNVYTPNSGERALERLDYRVEEWDPAFRRMVAAKRRSGGDLLVVGDLNCARTERDVDKPERKARSAGFTDRERESFEKLLKEGALEDAWRRRHPDEIAYSYWSYRTRARERDVGWRIDYVLTSDMRRVIECDILKEQTGSDHAPVKAVLRA